jgi:hypothetical protein
MCEEVNAGQSMMKCLGIRHWEADVKPDACCVFVVGSSVQAMKNERMEVSGVSSWHRSHGKSLMVHAPIVFTMPAYSDS